MTDGISYRIKRKTEPEPVKRTTGELAKLRASMAKLGKLIELRREARTTRELNQVIAEVAKRAAESWCRSRNTTPALDRHIFGHD